MSTKVRLALVISSMIVMSAPMAMASEEISYEITADYMGKYVWRGQLLNDDNAFQPGASATYGNFTAGIWGSMDLTNIAGERHEFTEVDYYLDYSDAVPGVEGLGFSVGYVYYDFPTTKGETEEVYLGLSLDVPLAPSVTVNSDIDDADGLYITGSLGHTFEDVVEIAADTPVSVDISASLGWGDKDYNAFYWATSKSEMNDFTLSVGLPFEVAGIGVTPMLSYVSLIGSDVKASNAYSTDNSYLFVGIGCSMSF